MSPLVILVLCFAADMVGCARAETIRLPFSATIGNFVVNVSDTAGLVITHKKLRKQFSTPSFPFLHSSCGEWDATEINGNFKVTDKPIDRTTTQTLTSATKLSSDAVRLSGALGYKGTSRCAGVAYTLTLSTIRGAANRLAFEARAVVRHEPGNFPAANGKISAPNRVILRWSSPKGESYHGLGHQYSVWNLRGRRVPILTTEQGVGRGLEPLTAALNEFSNGAGGNWHTTYTATPAFLTSRLWGMALRNTEPAVFDLCSAESAIAEVSVVNSGDSAKNDFPASANNDFSDSANNEFSDSVNNDFPDSANNDGKAKALSLRGELLFAASPLEGIHTMSDITGRMQPLPRWASGAGAVVGYEGGTEVVRALWRKLKAAGVPVSAFWLQDWSGIRITPFGSRLWWNWEIDTNFYRGWDNFVAELSRDGVRMMTYINPYLASNVGRDKADGYRRDLFKEAARKGLLVRNSTGQPYILTSVSANFSFGTIDLTNPAAVNWTVALIRCNMLRVGDGCGPNNTTLTGPSPYSAYGWMSDFAEYLPLDAVLHEGSASAVHNAFPRLWAEANRRAVEGVGFTGEDKVVFFSRSAALGSPSASTLFWMGDQLTTFDLHDGLQSAMLGMLSGGIVGHSLSHTDIGGYTMLEECLGEKKKICFKIARSKELLLRWMEMSAFSDAMFRSHVGNKPNISAQIYSDNETLSHFATFARVHAALYPYRVKLMSAAASTGAPLTRHPWLHYPHDHTASALTTQFMLGPDVMVAPVLAKAAKEVAVYLPGETDKWVHWSDARTEFKGGKSYTVTSPIGHPAVFARQNASLLTQGVWEHVSALLKQL